MALVTPPSWLQAGSYPAESDRLTMQALWASTGIIGTSSLAVTANSPAGMSVRVASGWAAILGTVQANQGVYTTYNDATTVLSVTTANPTNPRIDRVVVTVRDAYYSGAFNDVIFQVIAGTPAGSPVAPAVPDNSISLATIAVGAAVTQINSGNITDTRVNVTTNIPETGDISSVTAGTGLTGGGSSGAVTLNLDTTSVYVLPSQTSANGKYLTSNGTAASWADVYPSQTSQSGKYLTTNGTVVSWGTVDALPSQTGNAGEYLTTDGSTASWATITTDPTPTVFLLMGA
jgi:hypothetical protein